MNFRTLALLIAAVFISGCASARSSRMEWIRVADDGRGFVGASSGKPFTPWGFNYDRDYKSRLIEDYWQTEWPTVVEDFREMKQLGANVVRVHPQFGKFMDGPQKPNRKSLERLSRLLKLAEEAGIYLDITGLACFRRADVPAWYGELEEGQRWRAQANFWKAIAQTCADSPAVFCYDLMNEPIVPGGRLAPGQWLTGQLGGFCYIQHITIDSANRPRWRIALKWAQTLAAAIREHDRRHLITVGMLPTPPKGDQSFSGFVPARMAEVLDFICVHIYPNKAQLSADLETVRAFKTNKPLVIEEIFPMNCSAEQLGDFIKQSRPVVSGWIGFYWGRTPEQLRQSHDIGDAMTLSWLELFQKINPARP